MVQLAVVSHVWYGAIQLSVEVRTTQELILHFARPLAGFFTAGLHPHSLG